MLSESDFENVTRHGIRSFKRMISTSFCTHVGLTKRPIGICWPSKARQLTLHLYFISIVTAALQAVLVIQCRRRLCPSLKGATASLHSQNAIVTTFLHSTVMRVLSSIRSRSFHKKPQSARMRKIRSSGWGASLGRKIQSTRLKCSNIFVYPFLISCSTWLAITMTKSSSKCMNTSRGTVSKPTSA